MVAVNGGTGCLVRLLMPTVSLDSDPWALTANVPVLVTWGFPPHLWGTREPLSVWSPGAHCTGLPRMGESS